MKKFLLIIVLCLTLITQTVQASQHKEESDYKLAYLNLNWWQKYNDEDLINNLTSLYNANNDLKIASFKVKESEKIVKISFGQELPSLSFDGSLGRTFASSDEHFGDLIIPNFAQYNYLFPLTMTYEADIWGKNRLATKSRQKNLEMLKQDEKSIYISLTSSFAAQYFNLVKIDKLITIQKELIDIQKQVADKTETKYKNGLATVNDVIDEQKTLTYFIEEMNNLEEKQELLINQLHVYLADNDTNTVQRINYDDLSLLENLPSRINTETINNRPDIVKAELGLKKAGFDIKAARREFLPNFFIVGQLGFNAYQWSKIFSSSADLANLAVLPSIDLFTGGRKINFLKLRKLQYDEAVQRYEKSVLVSIQEVNDGLMSVKNADKNYKVSLERFALENKKYDLLNKKRNIGAASDLEVLAYRENVLLTKKNEVSNKINCLISTINLYKAVGGEDLENIAAKL